MLPILFYLSFSPLCTKNVALEKNSSKNSSCLNIKSLIFIALIIFSFASIFYKNYSLLFLPPLLISLTVLFPFVKSITPNYTPLLTQFYYLAEVKKEQKADPEKIKYTTILTWVWLLLISLLFFEILLLTFFAPLEIWSLFTNFINYLILFVFMLVEWFFRMLYFKQWFSPVTFIQQLICIDHRQLLQKKELIK